MADLSSHPPPVFLYFEISSSSTGPCSRAHHIFAPEKVIQTFSGDESASRAVD